MASAGMFVVVVGFFLGTRSLQGGLPIPEGMSLGWLAALGGHVVPVRLSSCGMGVEERPLSCPCLAWWVGGGCHVVRG